MSAVFNPSASISVDINDKLLNLSVVASADKLVCLVHIFPLPSIYSVFLWYFHDVNFHHHFQDVDACV